ncbi:MAG: hypothetical protein ACR2RA_15340 [Geminicoccaceae bacterium]
MTLLGILLRDQTGAAAVQHALVIGVVTLAVLAGSLALRGPLFDLYDTMGSQAGGALVAQPAIEGQGGNEG